MQVRLPLAELRRRDVITPIASYVVHRDPIDGRRRIALDRPHAAVSQRRGEALDLDDVAIRLRVLRLHPLEHTAATHNEVVVPVLTIWNRDLMAAPDDIGRDHDFREISL